MARSFPIRRPNPQADRPRPARLAAVAAAGLLLGLCTARATLRSADSESPLAQADRVSEPETEPDAHTETELGTEPDPETEPGTDPGTVADPDPIPEPGPAIETDPPADPDAVPGRGPHPVRARAIRHGRLAYLRCDGVEGSGQGPFPCPRDRDLERTVRAIIDTLPACAQGPAGTGPSDLRLTFQPGATPEVGFLDRTGDLEGSRIAACLTPALTGATTTLAADYLLVSFRFELVSAD